MYFESFLKLPVELVCQILGFLEYQDLLRCSEVRFYHCVCAPDSRQSTNRSAKHSEKLLIPHA
jgi:hypothetical protein